jgi:conjugative transfer signal peptidase TraF
MRRLTSKTLLYVGAGVLSGLLAAQVLASISSHTLILNYTASMPLGIYQRVPIHTWRHGMVVVITPSPSDKALFATRGWLMKKGVLIKPIGALPGDQVCIQNDTVTVNGKAVGPVYVKDSHGLPLPVIRGCFVLAPGTVFPFSTYSAHSFDGRYIGAIPMAQVLGEARPVWTF